MIRKTFVNMSEHKYGGDTTQSEQEGPNVEDDARPPSPHDVVTIGRVGIDLYPVQIDVGLEQAELFSKSVGGSATNVAIAAARLGRRSAVITRTGADPFGRYIRAELASLGVDTRFIGALDTAPTPITFCEIFPPDDFPLYFYRLPKAPDLEIRADELDDDVIRAAGVFWSTVTGLSAEPSRAAHHHAWAVRHRAPFTVLDLDYRAMFWRSRNDATAAIQEALPHVDVAIGNLEECEVAVGERDPERAADALLDRGVRLAIVKQGPLGVLAKTAAETVRVAPHPVTVVNGLGAGDAFGGAICHGLLAGWDVARTVRFANAAGAIVAGRRECSTAMPTIGEVEATVNHAAHV